MIQREGKNGKRKRNTIKKEKRSFSTLIKLNTNEEKVEAPTSTFKIFISFSVLPKGQALYVRSP